MRYGKDGTAPTFQNPLLSVVWSFIKTAVDHDAEVYDGKILQRQHAVYCREAKRRGETPMDFDTWKSSSDIDRCVPITSDIHYQHQDHTHSHIESRQIIGRPGAELLPRYGQGIYKTPEGIDTWELQMIPQEAIAERIKWWTDQKPSMGGLLRRLFGQT